MVPLTACMKAGGDGFPKTAKEALRALGAAAQHKAFGLVLLKTQGTVSCTNQLPILHTALLHIATPTPTRHQSPLAHSNINPNAHQPQRGSDYFTQQARFFCYVASVDNFLLGMAGVVVACTVLSIL